MLWPAIAEEETLESENNSVLSTLCQVVLLEEFRRGFEVCKQVLLTPHAVTPWARLFEPHQFFEVKNAFYVGVSASASPMHGHPWFLSLKVATTGQVHPYAMLLPWKVPDMPSHHSKASPTLPLSPLPPQVDVMAADSSDLDKWDGWVRSRVRILVRHLEDHAAVRPHPEPLRPPPESHPDDPRPRKVYYLCLSKKPAEVGLSGHAV